MHRKILTPENENLATKFYFGKSINLYTFHMLYDEFKIEGHGINKSNALKRGYVKFVNKKDKSSIEITQDYISFFPLINEEKDIEAVRKRIFKHVARKYEVYSETAKDNLFLSISSLVKNDLRTCASLLYYALHKFTNSLMYYFYNTELDKNDHEISIDEIEHYTSFMFLKFAEYFEKETNLDDIGQLDSILCHHTTKAKVDPFMLLRFIFKKGLNMELLLPYINYLSKSLFSVEYLDTSRATYEDVIKSVKNKPQKTINQEETVTAAIAYCYKESFVEDEKRDIWLLYIVALRLYWLRQTADYEFDFDVKTSVKEMSKLVFTVKSIIECLEEIISDEGKDKKESSINRKALENEESTDVNKENEKNNERKSIDCPLYSVDFEFPKEFFDEEKPTIYYMTVLHLDSEFEKDKILKALNFTANITNRNKYFIYEEPTNSGTIPLYLNLDDEGRWVFWFNFDKQNLNTFTEKDLRDSVKEFFSEISESYRDFYHETIITNLVGSRPQYFSLPISMLNNSEIFNIKEEIYKRETFLKYEIAYQLKSAIEDETDILSLIKIKNLVISINVLFGLYELNLVLPLNTKLFQSIKEDNQVFVQMNFIVVEEEDRILESALYNTMNDFSNLLGLKNFKNQYFITNSEVIENSIQEKDNYLKQCISSVINNVCYSDLESNVNILNAKDILEKCIEINGNNSYLFATLGYWHLLRNENPEDALMNGKRYYEKAMELAKLNNEEEISQFKQKYYLELARFYSERLNDNNNAMEYIAQGIDLDERFQNDFKDLIIDKRLNLIIDESKKYVAVEREIEEGQSNEEQQHNEDEKAK